MVALVHHKRIFRKLLQVDIVCPHQIEELGSLDAAAGFRHEAEVEGGGLRSVEEQSVEPVPVGTDRVRVSGDFLDGRENDVFVLALEDSGPHDYGRVLGAREDGGERVAAFGELGERFRARAEVFVVVVEVGRWAHVGDFGIGGTDKRRSALGFGPFPSHQMLFDPNLFRKSFRAIIDSASDNFPATPTISDGLTLWMTSATTARASRQLTVLKRPSAPRIIGLADIIKDKDSLANGYSSTYGTSFNRGTMRMTSGPLLSMRILEPTASVTSMLSVPFSSQLRALKAKGFEVRAPTGQISITFPDNSLVISRST
ncbi:cellulase [Striga asiatica]|uniref:Cellulase n=1 Tax=Striga asiatica TaxID=4170 RepID=A0A5A7P180_STRAF|nr:cellulase [Striga asiatica]